MEKIKATIVGLGRIGSLLEEDALREKPCTHAGAIAANNDCILVAGCDLDEERRKLFAEKWQVPVYDNAEEMLRIHKPQIFVIATHPDSHYQYCRLAAKIQLPVVICEKPLADNIKKARKIARLTASSGIVVITNHERRYSLDYIRAKTILEEGKLGKLVAVRAALYMGKTKRLLDMLWHDGTHIIDAIMFLTGMELKHKRRWGTKLTGNAGTAWLEGELQNKTTELHGGKNINKKNSVKLRGKNFPIPVILEIGAGRDHLVFEIEFSCEKGRLRIGNGVFEVWESAPSLYAENFRSLKNSGEEFTGPTGYFANMIKDAVACIYDPKHSPVSSATDGLRVIEYLNSVKKWRH